MHTMMITPELLGLIPSSQSGIYFIYCFRIYSWLKQKFVERKNTQVNQKEHLFMSYQRQLDVKIGITLLYNLLTQCLMIFYII